MDNNTLCDLDRRSVFINELAQGRELVRQLPKLLDPSFPLEERELLMNRILAIYNKALNVINFNGSGVGVEPLLPAPDPSQSSPQSTNYDVDQPRRLSKKRKTLPRREEKVKLNNGEDQLPSDGYGWRKYGQKIILGAKFRRGYFRCTHRHSQGCLAVKQVQQSDEDPAVFDVIYVGEHTCTAPYHISSPSANTNPPRMHPMMTQEPQIQAQLPQQTVPVFQPHLTVQTEGLDNVDQDKFYVRSFSFSMLFDESSGSNHYMNGVWTTELDPQDGFSAPNSGENSPTNKLEFTLEELGIDPNFPFHNPEMFS